MRKLKLLCRIAIFAMLAQCSSLTLAAATDTGAGLLRAPADKENWVLEHHNQATADLAIEDGALKLNVDGSGGPAWHVQLYEPGLDLTNGVAYIVRFRAKSSVAGPIQVYATADNGDAHSIGLSKNVALTTDWQKVELPFTASATVAQHSRAPVFALGKLTATVWIDQISITRADGVAVAPSPRALTSGAPATAPVDLTKWFPFAIPWDDAVAGTATDVSYLNDVRPAGAHGRIVVKDGHFVESNTGRRVRFLGINLGADEAFPTHVDADKIAAAMAKAGINVARLHHLDNSFAPANATLIDRTRPDRQHFVPEQLDKLDYLVGALSRNGIYSDLNLKVSHDLTVGDGFPPSVQKLPWPFQKRIDIFCRRMIDLQKDYARLLLTHENPYTKLTYAADPAIAFVEINNENSLLGGGMEPLGRGLIGHIPEPFHSELAGQWNAWLKKKYDDDTLAAAWKTIAPTGPPLVTVDSAWTSESRNGSRIQLSTTDDNTDPSAVKGHLIDVQTVGGAAWNTQAHITNLNLEASQTYTLSFRAKAEKDRKMLVSATADVSALQDWHNIGLAESVDVGTDWKTYTYVLDCQMPVPNHSRIAFIVGSSAGKLWISDLTLKQGAIGAGPKPGESLAAGNLALPELMGQAEYRDWVSFLADTEHAYADEMRSFLRKDLGVTAAITDTQVDFGGLTGVERESGSDYIDAHAYWEHPSFGGGKGWNVHNWSIENTPIVKAFGKSDGGALGELAILRVAGKPFMVSEYDHPAPTDFAAEMMPLLATFFAEQDWDGVYLFSMGPYGAIRGTDHITGFFDNWNHPAKRAFFATAALIMRANIFSPQEATKTLQLPARAYLNWPTAVSAWRYAMPAFPDPLTARLAVALATDVATPTIVDSSAAHGEAHSDAPAQGAGIRIVQGKNGPIWVATSNTLICASGYLPGYSLDADGTKIDLEGGKFAAMTIVPLDGASIRTSHHLLLTIAGKAANPDMGWNWNHTSVGTHWGHGPAKAEQIGGTITLTTQIAGLKCYSLDVNGKRAKPVKIESAGNGLSRVQLDHDTSSIWYEPSDRE